MGSRFHFVGDTLKYWFAGGYVTMQSVFKDALYVWTSLLSYCTFTLLATQTANQCQKVSFIEHKGMAYTGESLLRKGPWTRYDCERTCRLHPDCQAFAMEWLNGTKERGYCMLAGHKVNPEEAIANNISSIFEPPRNNALSCEASSEKASSGWCELALTDSSSWVSKDRGPGQWYKLIFAEPAYVSGLVLKSTGGGLQCRNWTLTYSYGDREDKITPPCVQGKQTSRLEKILTGFILLTCEEQCPEDPPENRRTLISYIDTFED